jgi:hypothetical protein
MPEPKLVRTQAHAKAWTGMYEVLGKLVRLSSVYGAVRGLPHLRDLKRPGRRWSDQVIVGPLGIEPG